MGKRKQTREARLINQVTPHTEVRTPIAGDMYLPNHSGAAPTPTLAGDIANKAYVDAAAGGDMTKAVYDTNDDGTVDAADTAAALTGAQATKLSGIETAADVTDTANVTSAGALMDSEVDADIKTLALPANTTISAFGATLVDDAAASNARTTLGLGDFAVLNTTSDHSSADTTYVPLVLYNTDATPPTASTVPIGTLYIQYTA